MVSERERTERSQQEKAQALVAIGRVVPAVRLLDAWLAQNDGDWGLWLYLAGLCSRLGWGDQSVAAYRACARKLEGDELIARARTVLLSASKAPLDASLARDVQRLGRLLPHDAAEQTCVLEAVLPRVDPAPRPSPWPVVRTTDSRRPAEAAAVEPSVDLAPRLGADPFSLLAEAPISFRPSRPAVERRPVPRLPDPKHHRTSVLTPCAERSMRDPHLAIFDILDAERASRRDSSPEASRLASRHDGSVFP